MPPIEVRAASTIPRKTRSGWGGRSPSTVLFWLAFSTSTPATGAVLGAIRVKAYGGTHALANAITEQAEAIHYGQKVEIENLTRQRDRLLKDSDELRGKLSKRNG